MAFATAKQGYMANIVIDDKPTLDWAQHDAWNILFDQPWNRDVETPQNKRGMLVMRGKGWSDILERIDSYLGMVT